eukprot:CAMPEP_0205936712 /NCGR_PEP_ID=MMETSP1325-20131115/42250_1 /ASSEMBLY_ACC=CAM_ASM_000708 /TAXON_ID=236786 /ORGANISM="Florenciella sp., Strain RCC1007" /LENGTH=62 /DNA_ID=CAMNT_0053306901 /DNA_START=50 /DNA_END=235 /DNA_ORIENTATION=+
MTANESMAQRPAQRQQQQQQQQQPPPFQPNADIYDTINSGLRGDEGEVPGSLEAATVNVAFH